MSQSTDQMDVGGSALDAGIRNDLWKVCKRIEDVHGVKAGVTALFWHLDAAATKHLPEKPVERSDPAIESARLCFIPPAEPQPTTVATPPIILFVETRYHDGRLSVQRYASFEEADWDYSRKCLTTDVKRVRLLGQGCVIASCDREKEFPKPSPAPEMKVYMDDVRATPQGYFRTFTVAETIDILKTGQVTELSLDHDLGDGVPEGYRVLNWLEEEVATKGIVPPDVIVIHSANSVGRSRMTAAIEQIRKHEAINLAKRQEGGGATNLEGLIERKQTAVGSGTAVLIDA